MFVNFLNEDIGPFSCIYTEFAIVRNMSKIVQSPLTCVFMVLDLHLIHTNQIIGPCLRKITK